MNTHPNTKQKGRQVKKKSHHNMNDITDLQPPSTPLTYFISDEYKNKFSCHIAVSSVLQGECQDGTFKETMRLFSHIFPSYHHSYISFDVE